MCSCVCGKKLEYKWTLIGTKKPESGSGNSAVCARGSKRRSVHTGTWCSFSHKEKSRSVSCPPCKWRVGECAFGFVKVTLFHPSQITSPPPHSLIRSNNGKVRQCKYLKYFCTRYREVIWPYKTNARVLFSYPSCIPAVHFPLLK